MMCGVILYFDEKTKRFLASLPCTFPKYIYTVRISQIYSFVFFKGSVIS